MDWHIMPVNDRKEHVQGDSCHCKPRIEKVDDNRIIVHNSYDCRELIEEMEFNLN